MFSERYVGLRRILCFIMYFIHLQPIFPGVHLTILKHRLQAYGQLTSQDTLQEFFIFTRPIQYSFIVYLQSI